MTTYDIVTVGGGVGGAALGRAMAERGYRVLIVERTTRFTDRVRGEFIFPWGVAEARELGVYDLLMRAGAHHPTYWTDYAGPDPLPPRNFVEDTAVKLPGLCMYHPRMQEALLEGAAAAGAEIRRGTRVHKVAPGRAPTVLLDDAGRQSTVVARLVVGADGRSSMVRKWCGFTSRDEPAGNSFTGVLLENVPASADSSICMINPDASRMVLYVPQAEDSGRAYLGSPSDSGMRLQGSVHFEAFLQECTNSGLASGLFDGARQAGPLATFDCGDSWVEHPYNEGTALIGDAAATADPTWGQGLSLTLRGVRELRDALLANDDWDEAGHAYADAHNQCYAKVRTAESWYTKVFMQTGPDADALRARVLPQMASEPFFLPDTLIAGPDFAPPTAEHRARIFGDAAALDHARGVTAE